MGPNLYAVTFEDRLVCLGLETGRLVWSFPSGFSNTENYFTTSPVTDGRKVYYADLTGVVHAFEPSTGKEVWKRNLGSRTTASPALLGGKLYVGAASGRLFRLDAKSGAVEADLQLPDTPVWPIAGSGNLLFLFLTDKAVVAVDSALKTIAWTQPGSAAWTSARPYVWRDSVLAGDHDGNVFAFRTADGVLRFTTKFEGMIRGIGSSQETLYLGTLKGMVYAWDPDVRH